MRSARLDPQTHAPRFHTKWHYAGIDVGPASALPVPRVHRSTIGRAFCDGVPSAAHPAVRADARRTSRVTDQPAGCPATRQPDFRLRWTASVFGAGQRALPIAIRRSIAGDDRAGARSAALARLKRRRVLGSFSADRGLVASTADGRGADRLPRGEARARSVYRTLRCGRRPLRQDAIRVRRSSSSPADTARRSDKRQRYRAR